MRKFKKLPECRAISELPIQLNLQIKKILLKFFPLALDMYSTTVPVLKKGTFNKK
jgi:hypothetical protein